MKTLILHVSHFAMPEMRFTYEKDDDLYTHLASEYLFMGKWVQFDKTEHTKLDRFLTFAIETDNLTVGFNDDGFTILEVN